MAWVILPGMVEQDAEHIVSMGLIAGTQPYPDSHCCGTAKGFRTVILAQPARRSGGKRGSRAPF